MDNGCGSGSCGCKGGSRQPPAAVLAAKALDGGYDAALVNSLTAPPYRSRPAPASPGPVASVNGVPLHPAGEYPD
jgi:hypothetical protein